MLLQEITNFNVTFVTHEEMEDVFKQSILNAIINFLGNTSINKQ